MPTPEQEDVEDVATLPLLLRDQIHMDRHRIDKLEKKMIKLESENLGRTEVEPCKSTLSAIETEADALVDAFASGHLHSDRTARCTRLVNEYISMHASPHGQERAKTELDIVKAKFEKYKFEFSVGEHLIQLGKENPHLTSLDLWPHDLVKSFWVELGKACQAFVVGYNGMEHPDLYAWVRRYWKAMYHAATDMEGCIIYNAPQIELQVMALSSYGAHLCDEARNIQIIMRAYRKAVPEVNFGGNQGFLRMASAAIPNNPRLRFIEAVVQNTHLMGLIPDNSAIPPLLQVHHSLTQRKRAIYADSRKAESRYRV